MAYVAEFEHVLGILDGFAPRAVIDRALRDEGLSRKAIGQRTGFLPYRSEAIVLETIARFLGDRHFGSRVGRAFDYTAQGATARYVLGAADLRSALIRGQRVARLVHTGSEITIRRVDENLVLGRASGLKALIGHRHIDEAALMLIISAIRHFLGESWRPEWVEVPAKRDGGEIDEIFGAPARTGAPIPALAIRIHDLSTPNPRPPPCGEAITIGDLPSLMGICPPRTIEDSVREVLHMNLLTGDLSEDGVARSLQMGPRSLQRGLMTEGTTFREIRARVIEQRARELLGETNNTVAQIARSLGYTEPNSFHRAFRMWTGMSPGVFRASSVRDRSPSMAAPLNDSV